MIAQSCSLEVGLLLKVEVLMIQLPVAVEI
jgi:hypothetical protein